MNHALWCVRLPYGDDKHTVYGPFLNSDDAQEFADFLSAEVDPAVVEPLLSPSREISKWRRHVAGGQ